MLELGTAWEVMLQPDYQHIAPVRVTNFTMLQWFQCKAKHIEASTISPLVNLHMQT